MTIVAATYLVSIMFRIQTYRVVLLSQTVFRPHRQQGGRIDTKRLHRRDTAPAECDFTPRGGDRRDVKLPARRNADSRGGIDGGGGGGGDSTASGGSIRVATGDPTRSENSWTSPAQGGKRVPGIPPDVRRTNALPSKLRCDGKLTEGSALNNRSADYRVIPRFFSELRYTDHAG